MNKDKLIIFNTITNVLLILILFLGGFVWADSNGVWHRAEDVQGGIFGNDEQDTSASIGFRFLNQVIFDTDVYYKGIELDARYVNENQSNSITSNMIVDGTISVNDINSSEIATKSYVDTQISINRVSLPTCLAGQSLISTGSGWKCKVPLGSSQFITPGSFTFEVPVGVIEIRVDVVGGGGNGGYGANEGAGCGGGGGGYSKGTISVTPGQIITGVVGGGGGTSTISSISASGGGSSSEGCTSGWGYSGAAGGIGSTQNGETGGSASSRWGTGGTGGRAYGPYGGTGGVGSAANSDPPISGSPGNNYGGGGGGTGGSNYKSGGSGASGIVVIEWGDP